MYQQVPQTRDYAYPGTVAEEPWNSSNHMARVPGSYSNMNTFAPTRRGLYSSNSTAQRSQQVLGFYGSPNSGARPWAPPHTTQIPSADVTMPSMKASQDSSTSPDQEAAIWEIYNRIADAEDREFVKAASADLDVLLIFAGIFASINVAFIIDSLNTLKPDPADTTNELLRAILLVLESNSQVPIPPGTKALASPTKGSKTNVLLFLSLCTSLAGIFLAVMGKQWLSHYERGGFLKPPAQRALDRQNKFDGSRRYHLQRVIESLPALLQISLLIFLIAVCNLLMPLDTSAAACVTIFTCFIFITWASLTGKAAWNPIFPYQTRLSVDIFRRSWFSRPSSTPICSAQDSVPLPTPRILGHILKYTSPSDIKSLAKVSECLESLSANEDIDEVGNVAVKFHIRPALADIRDGRRDGFLSLPILKMVHALCKQTFRMEEEDLHAVLSSLADEFWRGHTRDAESSTLVAKIMSLRPKHLQTIFEQIIADVLSEPGVQKSPHTGPSSASVHLLASYLFQQLMVPDLDNNTTEPTVLLFDLCLHVSPGDTSELFEAILKLVPSTISPSDQVYSQVRLLITRLFEYNTNPHQGRNLQFHVDKRYFGWLVLLLSHRMELSLTNALESQPAGEPCTGGLMWDKIVARSSSLLDYLRCVSDPSLSWRLIPEHHSLPLEKNRLEVLSLIHTHMCEHRGTTYADPAWLSELDFRHLLLGSTEPEQDQDYCRGELRIEWIMHRCKIGREGKLQPLQGTPETNLPFPRPSTFPQRESNEQGPSYASAPARFGTTTMRAFSAGHAAASPESHGPSPSYSAPHERASAPHAQTQPNSATNRWEAPEMVHPPSYSLAEALKNYRFVNYIIHWTNPNATSPSEWPTFKTLRDLRQPDRRGYYLLCMHTLLDKLVIDDYPNITDDQSTLLSLLLQWDNLKCLADIIQNDVDRKSSRCGLAMVILITLHHHILSSEGRWFGTQQFYEVIWSFLHHDPADLGWVYLPSRSESNKKDNRTPPTAEVWGEVVVLISRLSKYLKDTLEGHYMSDWSEEDMLWVQWRLKEWRTWLKSFTFPGSPSNEILRNLDEQVETGLGVAIEYNNKDQNGQAADQENETTEPSSDLYSLVQDSPPQQAVLDLDAKSSQKIGTTELPSSSEKAASDPDLPTPPDPESKHSSTDSVPNSPSLTAYSSEKGQARVEPVQPVNLNESSEGKDVLTGPTQELSRPLPSTPATVRRIRYGPRERRVSSQIIDQNGRTMRHPDVDS